jgi:hypothetical protein
MGANVPLFYIEMGQGIIANGDLRLRTSALLSCTLIGGYSAASRYGGAYHYPSAGRNNPSVRADMDLWAAVLRPTAVILVFATQSGLLGTSLAEQLWLQNWVTQRCNVVPLTSNAVGAGVQLNPFAAGAIQNLTANFNVAQINVQTRQSGTYLDHGRFTLIGRDRNLA